MPEILLEEGRRDQREAHFEEEAHFTGLRPILGPGKASLKQSKQTGWSARGSLYTMKTSSSHFTSVK